MKISEHKAFWPTILTTVAISLMVWGHVQSIELRKFWLYGEVATSPEGAREQYQVLQDCIGMKASVSFDELSWKVGIGWIPKIYANSDKQLNFVGAFDAFTHTIYFKRGHETRTGVVNHEMMHAILSPRGGHPEFAFNRKCGTIID